MEQSARVKSLDSVYDAVMLPAFEDLKADKLNYARSFYTQYCNTDPFTGKTTGRAVRRTYVCRTESAFKASFPDRRWTMTYSYPYMRTYHPSYEKDGGVPAISEVKFSLISNRGCFGGCSFCALTFHQGRIIQTRSHESLLEEAEHITQDTGF